MPLHRIYSDIVASGRSGRRGGGKVVVVRGEAEEGNERTRAGGDTNGNGKNEIEKDERREERMESDNKKKRTSVLSHLVPVHGAMCESQSVYGVHFLSPMNARSREECNLFQC